MCLCVRPQLSSGCSYGFASVLRRRVCAIFGKGFVPSRACWVLLCVVLQKDDACQRGLLARAFVLCAAAASEGSLILSCLVSCATVIYLPPRVPAVSSAILCYALRGTTPIWFRECIGVAAASPCVMLRCLCSVRALFQSAKSIRAAVSVGSSNVSYVYGLPMKAGF